MFSGWLKDIRYASRMLLASPVFTVIAVLSIAIGIGANTTIFSFANGLLLQPIHGVADGRRVVDIGRTDNGHGFDTTSYPNFMDLRERTRTLQDVYAYEVEPQAMSLGGEQDAERVYGTVVSGNFFHALGVQPQAGRMLLDSDDQPGSTPVAVISDGLWKRRFSSNPAIVGQTIMLNAHRFTVVGVAPPEFIGTTVLKIDLWAPMGALNLAMPRRSADLLHSRRSLWVMMGGRMNPGVTIAQVNAELAAIAQALGKEFPAENKDKGLVAAPLSRFPGRTGVVAGFVGLLMALVVLVLLVACVNLSGMLLARAVSRRHEIAVRLAIGASRWQLIRQLLTETAGLFLLGCAAGLLLTRWMTSALLALVPRLPVPVTLEASGGWRVVVFAAAISIIAGAVSGLAPAWQATSRGLLDALKSIGSNAAPSRMRLRDAFLVAQVTVSLLLVIVAALFLRGLQHASRIDPGFDQRGVEVISLDLSLAGYTPETGRAFLTDLLARTGSMAGVEAVTAATDLPLDGNRMGFGGVRAGALQDLLPTDANAVAPGFFRTLNLPLVRGRDFDSGDTANAQRVAIVNQALARRLWPDQDPIGKVVTLADDQSDPGVTLTVIGVASDARLVDLNEPAAPYLYLPLSQQYSSRVSLLVRSSLGVPLVPRVRGLLHAISPDLPVVEAMPLSDITAITTVPERIAGAVAGSLGLLVVMLAAIGLYGITSYVVSRRRREIAIRVALGADNRRVLRFVMRHGIYLAGLGIGAGLLLAAAASQLVRGYLFGVPPLDPVAFVAGGALFGVVTLAASYIPARRASLVDPLIALRAD